MKKNKNLPNFFIIGAPKCGTTSLYYYLKKHPNIFLSYYKEPYFFATDFPDKARLFSKKDKYLKECFKGAKNYKIIGEASACYLYSKKAVPNILKLNPEAKFIAMIRNPVDMARSLYFQLKNSLKFRENAKSFKKAWDLQGERRKGKKIPKHCKAPQLLQYGKVCKLGEQIKRLLKTVPNENQVKIIRLEQIKKEPEKVYRQILDFLDLEYDGRTKFPVHNKSNKVRSILIKRIMHIIYIALRPIIKKIKQITNTEKWNLSCWNKVERKKPSLENNFKKKLENYFKEDQKLLQTILKKKG